MKRIKIRLFINVLPENDTIPCSNMHYSIVPAGKKPNEFLWDMPKVVGSITSKPFMPYDLKNKNTPFDKQNNKDVLRLMQNRQGLTDKDGYTKDLYLPTGKYDIWIKRNDSAWELAYLPSGGKGFIVKENITTYHYQIRHYYRYKLLNFNGKPFSGHPFEVYTYDENGKERKISPTNVKGKITDKNGLTPCLYTKDSYVLFVKFKFANMNIAPQKKEIKPYATLSKNNYIEVQLKAVASISKDKISTTVNLQGTGKPPVILNALRDEMIVLSAEDYAEFEKESSKLDKIFGNAIDAKKKLAEAIKLGSTSSVKKAEDEVKEAERKIEEELNKNFKQAKDLTEVITFEARQKKNPNGNTQEFDFRRRYLRTDRYMQLQQKRKNKESYKVTYLGQELKKLKNIKEDIKKINQQVIHDEFKKVSIELVKYSANTGTKVWDFSEFSNAFIEQIKLGNNLSIDIQSQWLRCIGGAQASSSISWSPDEVSAKANVSAHGKLVLFEAKAKTTLVIPSDKGWMLNYSDIDLGAFRFIIAMELYGFAGAKVAAGIGLEVAYKNNKQLLTATGNRNKNPSLANNMKDSRPRFVPMEKDDAALLGSGATTEGKIEVFAGVEAGIQPSGELQWLSPEQSEFKALASLAVDFAASAGIGLGANFKLFYWAERNQFRFRAKAALCAGVGAKGSLDFVIDFSHILELLKWLNYQLMRAKFTVLGFIAEEAFTNLSRLVVIVLGNNDSPTAQMLINISQKFNEFNNEYAIAKASVDLANKIKRKPDWLKYAPPEAKGMLIYQMTRHNKVTHLVDRPKLLVSPYLPIHKEAVLAIFETITTEAEWFNVLQRMSMQGIKSDWSIQYLEKQMLAFLHDGYWSQVSDGIKGEIFDFDTVGQGSEYVEKYKKLRSKIVKTIPLHEKAPKGSPRELRKLREKMIEKPSIINEDVLVALNTEEIPIIKVDNTEADNFIAGVSTSSNLDDSHMV